MQAYPPNHYPSLNYSSSSSLVIWIKKSKQKLFLSSKEERLEKSEKRIAKNPITTATSFAYTLLPMTLCKKT